MVKTLCIRDFWILNIAFLLSMSISYSLFVEQDITEEIVVVELLNGNYSLKVNGQVEIINPSLTSPIYEFSYRVSPPAGIFGSLTVPNNINNNDIESGYLSITGLNLAPNSSVIIEYRFSGIMNESFRDEFSNSTSFLELFSTPRFIVKTSINEICCI